MKTSFAITQRYICTSCIKMYVWVVRIAMMKTTKYMKLTFCLVGPCLQGSSLRTSRRPGANKKRIGEDVNGF